MALHIDSRIARNLIANPVMAAKVVMGADLDTFQAARFRTWWFVPHILDHSGVSTAKSELVFILSFLRCILLPNLPGQVPRIACVYYQSKGTAQEVFLPKIDKYCLKSRVFENQLKIQHGRKLVTELDGCFLIEGRDGFRLELPAGNFIQDAKSQASKRFNDLYVDETGEIDKMGKGINKQLIQRNTLECFNPNHPIFKNKQVFLGHAEDPSHPYHKRLVAFRKHIRAGSQNHAILTSSYRDYRGEHLKRYGQDITNKAEEQRNGELDAAEAAQVLDGLWERGTKGWYSSTLVDGMARLDLAPQFSRADDKSLYFFGKDFAPGMKGGADFNAGVVTAATPMNKAELPADFDPLGVMEFHGVPWFIRPVYAYFLHGPDVDVLSGVVHRLHLAFGFTGIALDGGGGGAWVYKKLVQPRQFIDNKWIDVRGVCTLADAHQHMEADPVVSFFDRGDPLFRTLFGERFVIDNSGPVAYAHETIRAMMGRGQLAWPATLKMRLESAHLRMADLTQEQLSVLEALDKVVEQFGNIGVKIDGKTNQVAMSEKGFRKFVKNGKTDGCMAAIQSVLCARAYLESKPKAAESTVSMGFFA